MNSEFVAQQVLGFVGVVMALILSSSPVMAMSARSQDGSLAGLDTRYWPLYWINNMLWCIYATMIGDAWVLMSVLPPAVMWLHFCLGAIRLLGQEEGELLPMSKPTVKEGIVVHCEQGSPELHHSSVQQRISRIRSTQFSISVCMSSFLVVAFLGLSPRLADGVAPWDELVSPRVRRKAVGTIAALSSLICHVIPIRGLYAICKLRNASSIYSPTLAGWLLVCMTWGIYGWLKLDYTLYGPNTIGVCIYLAQLFLKYIFWQHEASTGGELPHLAAKAEDINFERETSAPASESSVFLDLSAKLACSKDYELYLIWQRNYRDLRQCHSSKVSEMEPQATALHLGEAVTAIERENICSV